MDKIRKIYDKKIFVTAFLATIIIHGEILFNKISFHDDLDTLFDGWTNSISHGRWMYHFLSLIPKKFAGMESVPVLIGMIVAACIGLMACIVFELFHIKNNAVQFAMILIMSSIPAVAGEFGYMGYAGYDFIGKLLCVVSVYLICRKSNGKRGIIASIVGAFILACSIGEYQCHLTFFLSMMLVYFTQSVLEKEMKWKEFWGKAVSYVGMAVIGLGLYLLILEIVLSVTGIELTSYAGMDSYGIVKIPEYIERVVLAYKEFLRPNAIVAYTMFPFRWNWWKRILLLSIFGLTGFNMIMMLMKQKYQKCIQLIIAFALFPLGMNFNFVLYGQTSTHSLHMYQYILLFVYLAIFMDYTIQNVSEVIPVKAVDVWGKKAIQTFAVAVMFIFSILYIRYDNMCYMQLEMRQEAAIRYFGTLATKIESIDGYHTDYPVAYINADQKTNISDQMYIYYDTPVTNPFNMEVINSYNWMQFMEYWCGFAPMEISADEYANHPEVEVMPNYPNDGSIKIIDDVIVVKF